MDREDTNGEVYPIKVFVTDSRSKHLPSLGTTRSRRILSSSAECSQSDSPWSYTEKAHIVINDDVLKELKLTERTIVEPRELRIHLNDEYSNYLESARAKLPNVLEERINTIFSARSVKSSDLPKPVFPKFRKEFSTVSENKSKYQRNTNMRDISETVLDEAINNVAKANYKKANIRSRLPELKAAQCKMYPKQDSRLDLLYATNKHGRHTHRSFPGMRSFSLDSGLQHDSGLPRDYPVYKSYEALACADRLPSVPRKPVLPEEMNSKEYIMSWLIHGSAPMSESHFPHVTGSDNLTKKQKNSKSSPKRHTTRKR